MHERQGYFDRRPSSDEAMAGHETANGVSAAPARPGVTTERAADVPAPVPQPRSPGSGPAVSANQNLRAGTGPAANSSEEISAAELERQARALEGAAVKAAAAARAARATANGRSQGPSDDGDDPARRAGELERQANDLYDEALRARLRADAAADEVRPDIPAAHPEEALAGSEELPVVTWNRRELDWTTLLEAAIDDHPAVADPRQDGAAPQAGPTAVKGGLSDETEVATPPSPR